MTEYSGYAKWVPAGGESSKGTLLWEFGRKIAEVVGIGKNALFNVLLANLLMESLVRWRLTELLGGVTD